MATRMSPSRKNQLAKKGRQTRWAPFWTVPKVHGKGVAEHPGGHTTVKRSWRRTATKVKRWNKNAWRHTRKFTKTKYKRIARSAVRARKMRK